MRVPRPRFLRAGIFRRLLGLFPSWAIFFPLNHFQKSQLFLDSDRNHMVICSLTLSHQPGHPPLPSRFCVRLRSLSTFDCQLLTSPSSTFQCTGRLPRLPRLRRLPRLGRGPDLVGELLGALDFSSLGLTLNLQLSTFNCLSFPSSRLTLSQRASKPFIIRTYEHPSGLRETKDL